MYLNPTSSPSYTYWPLTYNTIVHCFFKSTSTKWANVQDYVTLFYANIYCKYVWLLSFLQYFQRYLNTYYLGLHSQTATLIDSFETWVSNCLLILRKTENADLIQCFWFVFFCHDLFSSKSQIANLHPRSPWRLVLAGLLKQTLAVGCGSNVTWVCHCTYSDIANIS